MNILFDAKKSRYSSVSNLTLPVVFNIRFSFTYS